MKAMKKDLLQVKIYETRAEMGVAAAQEIKAGILKMLETKETINMIFAAAPSQNEVLASLAGDKEIPWNRVNAFHMDEYIGLSPEAPQGFGNFLNRAIFDKVNFKEKHYLLCEADKAEEKCKEYSNLLKEYPIDLIFLGIGENGHLAFNDPAVADFDDPKIIKVVELDDICRQQQVNDGCFATLNDVPKQAMSLTMSFIMSVPHAICVVPTIRKANAVYNALLGPVTTDCPASILREHKDAALYLDKDSSSKIL